MTHFYFLFYYGFLACLFIYLYYMVNSNAASQGYFNFTNCFLGIIEHFF